MLNDYITSKPCGAYQRGVEIDELKDEVREATQVQEYTNSENGSVQVLIA